MKKSKYIFMLSAALLGAACSDIIESSESVSFPDKEIILTATREGLQPGTRSFRLDDGSVWWSPNEEVSVFYGAGSNGGSKFVSMNTAIAETVELQGSVQMAGSGKDFWAVYPYSEDNSCDGSSITTVIPDVQTGVEGNFSNDVFPAISKSSSMSLAFWNICGGVKFFVSRSDIKSVTFKGNNNEPLAGKVKVTFGSDGTPLVQEVIEGKTEVTLVAPDGGFFKPGKYYYITLLPASLDGGITMVFKTETEKGELVSDKAQTVKRSFLGVLKSIDSKVSTWESTAVQPEAVDLGLSVKWATFNVGATKPEEYGDYFAWGETEPKDNYDGWSSYKWGHDEHKLTKYITDSDYSIDGRIDNNTVLDLEDDAAHVNWGGRWRIPTEAEWTELREKCTWTWTSDYDGTGIAGRIVTSTKPGFTDKSIFLPAAGEMYGTTLNSAGSYGFYWSSSLYITPNYAGGISFSSVGIYGGSARCDGFSVRPVDDELIPESVINIPATIEIIIGRTATITVKVSPDATFMGLTWSSSDESVAVVNDKGTVTAVSIGKATIVVNSVNPSVTATCEVTVIEPPKPEVVDLGLSVNWANFNVGASSPDGDGDYFAWGETHTKPKSSFVLFNYKFWLSGDSIDNAVFSKYNTYSSLGIADNKTVLDLEDDAAHILFGEKWRIPTYLEWQELFDNCIVDKASIINGIKGSYYTSKINGNSIFIPNAVSYTDSFIYGTEGYYYNYWSSSLSDDSYYAYTVSGKQARYCGLQIRPVVSRPDANKVCGIWVDKQQLRLYEGRIVRINANVCPITADNKSIVWSSSNTDVATVDENGKVKAISVGAAVITVATIDGGYTVDCPVFVSESTKNKAIDLGLSVLWASSNVGAKAPEDCGDFFAWGETLPYYCDGYTQDESCQEWRDGKEQGYHWSSYSFMNGGFNQLTKYCTKSNYWGGIGEPDGLIDLSQTDPPYEDDVARAYLGEQWRIPTYEEWIELRDNCEWILINQNDVNGYLVKSKISGYTNNSIFLPLSGSRYETLLVGNGEGGHYWCSSICANSFYNPPSCAYFVAIEPKYGVYISNDKRYTGFSIRPVTK